MIMKEGHGDVQRRNMKNAHATLEEAMSFIPSMEDR